MCPFFAIATACLVPEWLLLNPCKLLSVNAAGVRIWQPQAVPGWPKASLMSTASGRGCCAVVRLQLGTSKMRWETPTPAMSIRLRVAKTSGGQYLVIAHMSPSAWGRLKLSTLGPGGTLGRGGVILREKVQVLECFLYNSLTCTINEGVWGFFHINQIIWTIILD